MSKTEIPDAVVEGDNMMASAVILNNRRTSAIHAAEALRVALVELAKQPGLDVAMARQLVKEVQDMQLRLDEMVKPS